MEPPIIRVDGLVKHYKKRGSKERVRAVDGVSFEVGRGEVLGLLGPNGAGKSTTIKMICGLVRPDGGTVWVAGIDNSKGRLRALQHLSAVLEGNRNLYWRLTARENLEYFAGNRGRSRGSVQGKIAELLERFRLTDKADELVNNLSRGMQQKLAIAVALLADTDVILLDEPTLGLDVETGFEVRERLRDIARSGRTVIISTHDMAVVQDLCERTVIINAGKVLVDDRVSNLLRLFETRAYTVTLGAPLSASQEARLKETFPVVSLFNGDTETTIRVNLEHSEDIYTLVDILREERTPIESIDRTVVNFERVFLELVRRQEVESVVA